MRRENGGTLGAAFLIWCTTLPFVTSQICEIGEPAMAPCPPVLLTPDCMTLGKEQSRQTMPVAALDDMSSRQSSIFQRLTRELPSYNECRCAPAAGKFPTCRRPDAARVATNVQPLGPCASADGTSVSYAMLFTCSSQLMLRITCRQGHDLHQPRAHTRWDTPATHEGKKSSHYDYGTRQSAAATARRASIACRLSF